MKKIITDEEGKSNFFKDNEIVYPFCFKTKESKYNGISYYRYLEDGRFEHISLQEMQMHMTYGNHSNFIHSLVSDNEYYFRVLASRHIIITQHEFEQQRDEYFKRYNDYLEGLRYIASEVEQLTNNNYDAQENPG